MRKTINLRVDAEFYKEVVRFKEDMERTINADVSITDATRLLGVRRPIMYIVRGRKKNRFDISKIL